MTDATRFPAIVVEELIGAVPTLIDRTRAQVELTQYMIGHLPCLARRATSAAHDPSTTSPGGPGRDGAADSVSGSGAGATVHELRPTAAPAGTDSATVPAGPDVGQLAIPDYDSLAASQVVPRLASLDADELADVGAYERSHRGRQTILNRVRQLQAAGER